MKINLFKIFKTPPIAYILKSGLLWGDPLLVVEIRDRNPPRAVCIKKRYLQKLKYILSIHVLCDAKKKKIFWIVFFLQKKTSVL